ncbi:alpha/beta hydrolase [Kitasatospora sp. NPDC056327]|uniref:alpha/beta hydrolase n=1 Tax=Kitasatospora sp. NPDC056327 TaxID=3345785 RepID=UPI0035D5AC62
MIRAAKPAAAVAALALTFLTAPAAAPAFAAGAPPAARPAVTGDAGPLAPPDAPTGPDALVGPDTPAGSAALAALHRQEPVWHPCATGPEDAAGAALDAAGARCTEVTVPLDHRRPAGRTLSVALSRLPAADPAHRLGTLFYNPGGPGVPARHLALALREAAPALGARYDIVGMDPRFVGASTPLDCGWPTAGPGSAGTDRPTFDRTAEVAKNLAVRCAPYRELLPHASTRNTARDMDLVRAVLGEQTISYLGSSYGSYLGQVYLQLFPGRVGRAVLDAALDPDRFGPDLTATQGPAMNAALTAWAGWAARHDGTYHLGGSTAGVLAAVERVRLAAGRAPLAVGTHRVDARILPQVLWAVSAGDDEASYPDFTALVRVLLDAAEGGPAEPTPLLEGILTGLASPDTGGSAAVQNAVMCADRAAPRDPLAYYRDIQAHRADEPLFGPLTRNLTPCTFWPAEPAEPPTLVRNAVPVLLVGADGDPAATYPGQLSAHRALSGSRLVTLRGAFRHTVYAGMFAPRDACVDAAVDRYLLDGVLPVRDADCVAVRP